MQWEEEEFQNFEKLAAVEPTTIPTELAIPVSIPAAE